MTPRPSASPLKIAQVATVAISVTNLMKGWPRFLHEQGFEVHTVCSPGAGLEEFAQREGVRRAHTIEIARRISPLADLLSLWRLYRLFRRERYALVHSSTPKGGFLGMLAAWLARTPARVYTLRGLPLASTTGVKRRILWLCDWLTMRAAHRVTAISASLRDEAVALGLAPPGRITVVHKGSSNGIDVERFTRRSPAPQADARRRWNIPPDALVIGFAGRIVRDKGIVELHAAWQRVREQVPAAMLLLLGDPEPEDPAPHEVLESLRGDERVRMPGWQSDMVAGFEAMDLLALPTYREGFGNVLLEANAMGLPVIATNISGCRDAVADSETGILVPPRDADALAAAMLTLARDPALRARMGADGRARVERDFRPQVIWRGLLEVYGSVLPAGTVDRLRDG
ncbi:MAG: glycosyltransferase family 4 protein [Phycisphaerales bacterium]|nr:glycosyltransferase family 4 protein [Phycisphaerales bacterium]